MKDKLFSTALIISLGFAFSIMGCSGNSANKNSRNIPGKKPTTTSHKDDSLLVQGLLDEAWKWQSLNPDSCILIANQAMSLAKKYNLKTSQAEAYCRIGNSEEAKGNYEVAINNYRNAFVNDSIAGNSPGMARDNYQTGIIFKKQGRYADALVYSIDALHRWEKIPDKKINAANACISIGNIYHRQGQFDLALKYFFRCLDTAKATNSIGLMADASNSIGLVYEDQALYDRALEMYKQSLEIEEQRKNQKGIAGSYNNIGNIFYHKSDPREALEWYLKSVELKERLNLTQNMAGTYNNIGLIYESLGQNDSALNYHTKSLALRESSGDAQGIATSNNNIGVINLKQGKKREAIIYFKKALAIARQSDSQFILLEILKNLSDAYASSADYNTAFSYTQQYQSVRDSLENHFRKATETDISYKEEKNKGELLEKEKEKQTAELEKNYAVNETQKAIVYSLCIFIILLVLLFFVLWRSKKRALIARQQAKSDKQKIDDMVRDQELNALRMMIETQEKERKRISEDLHDRLGIKLATAQLYYNLIGKKLQANMLPEEQQQYESGNSMLDEACIELREVAHNLVSGELMKFGLVTALKNLCDTISNASQIKLQFHAFGMDDRLDSAAEHSLYQIIQELLANAMKHSKAKEITVQLNRYNHTLNVLVEDDGIGFDPESATLNRGIGLKNIHERVKQINGTLSIDSEKNRGTTVSIDISI